MNELKSLLWSFLTLQKLQDTLCIVYTLLYGGGDLVLIQKFK